MQPAFIEVSNPDKDLQDISQKVLNGIRISNEDAMILFERADLPLLGMLANHMREKKHGDATYFNRNFHLEPTNICLYTCTFCSYSRLIKKRSEGWEYTLEDMMDIVKSYEISLLLKYTLWVAFYPNTTPNFTVIFLKP